MKKVFKLLFLFFITISCNRNIKSVKIKNKEIHFQIGFKNDLVKVYNNQYLIFEKRITTEAQIGLAEIVEINPNFNKISVVTDLDSIFFNTKNYNYYIISYNKSTGKLWYDHFSKNDSLIYE